MKKLYRATDERSNRRPAGGFAEAEVKAIEDKVLERMLENAGLQPLHVKARLLANEIGRVTFEHVGRALNAHADRLANQAIYAASGA